MNFTNEVLILMSHVLFGFFVLGAVGNWWKLIFAIAGRRRGSGLPLVPGVLGCVGLLIAPEGSDIVQLKSVWMLPIFVDPGGVIWIAVSMWHWLRNRKSKDGKTNFGQSLRK